MKLMHVAAADIDGTRLDMHVVAETPEQAISLWVAATDDEPEQDVIDRVEDVVVILPDVTGTILDGPARAIGRDKLETVHRRHTGRD